MKNSPLFAALLVAFPLASIAQTSTAPTRKPTSTAPAAGTQQVTEVTEELDPETGKVIRRTTRTTTVPIGTPAAAAATGPAQRTATTATTGDAEPGNVRATDAQVTSFFREKTAVSTLNAADLVEAYGRFLEKVREDRREWTLTDWNRASAVLSSLNARYEQLRSNMPLEDKITVRSLQAEFQALRTARQLSKDVSEKF